MSVLDVFESCQMSDMQQGLLCFALGQQTDRHLHITDQGHCGTASACLNIIFVAVQPPPFCPL